MFFVYDFGEMTAQFRWNYDRFFYERWCHEALTALLEHPMRTDDPEQADYFVVSDSLRCVPFAAVENIEPVFQGDGQPHISSGKPHVYFDLTDRPQPMVDRPNVIVCKTAFHQRYYNPHRAVPIPQFPRYRFERPFVPANKRRHLAGFKGNPRAQYGNLRERLFALDDGERFAFKSGVLKAEDIEISHTGEVREMVSQENWPHTEILLNSTFAVLPRACGYALSYRMIEAMNAGCIPVIVSDGYVLPFCDELDYRQFSIRIAESDIEKLPEILQSGCPDATQLQRNAIAVYESYFASTEKIIWQTVRHLDDRVRARGYLQMSNEADHDRCIENRTLTEIANFHSCDKGTLVGLAGPPHGYTSVYERLLMAYRGKSIKLLEIGIFHGASLRTWYDFLPHARIIALDRQDLQHLGNDRTEIFTGDQGNREDLQSLLKKSGDGFDVIIDDGGHHMDQQQISLGCLFSSLKPRGVYCIEDLHTSNDPAFGAETDRRNTTLSVLRTFVETGRFESPYMTESEIETLNREVEQVTLHCDNKLAIIYKKTETVTSQWNRLNSFRRRLQQSMLQITPSDLSEKSVVAHVGVECSPTVTIVMAVYNVADYICESLDSCLNQNYSNVEIIVVDDCSTDGTTQICERYTSENAKISLIRNDCNEGAYVSRNRGIQAARGELICWHDGDDLMHPDRVRLHRTEL